jgi:hippurate hydrolase
MNEILKVAESMFDELKEIRRFLHKNAEVGFDLKNTVAFIEKKLKEYGYEPKRVGKSGLVVCVGESLKTEKSVLLRADMDGLPIKEKSGEKYACKNGNMHACGHDLHATALLGAARILKKREKSLKGRVKLLFQPAEEILLGAKAVVSDGVLENPKVDCAFSLHVATGIDLPCGAVIVPKSGVGAPAADFFKIQVKGKGCHGSSPQNGVDTALVCSQILIALQTVIAREIPPSETAALTIGRISSGNAANAIASDGVLEGTLRAFEEKTREKMKRRLKEIASGVAKSFQAKANVIFTSGCPALVNDKELTKYAYEKAQELLGKEKVFSAENGGESNKDLGGSEDFAYITKEVPAVMLAVGAGARKDGYEYPLHHEKVRFDERALPVCSALYSYFALNYNQ